MINGNLGISNDSLAIRPSQLENLTINPIESGDPSDTMTWSTSQEATWRRVNLLGNLLEAALPYTTGLCLSACAPFPGSGINGSGAVENGFEVANSNITGDVIDTNGQNTAGVSGQDGNSDPYIQGSDIGGAQGFGSDTMFAGDTGNVPATNFVLRPTPAPLAPTSTSSSCRRSANHRSSTTGTAGFTSSTPGAVCPAGL